MIKSWHYSTTHLFWADHQHFFFIAWGGGFSKDYSNTFWQAYTGRSFHVMTGLIWWCLSNAFFIFAVNIYYCKRNDCYTAGPTCPHLSNSRSLVLFIFVIMQHQHSCSWIRHQGGNTHSCFRDLLIFTNTHWNLSFTLNYVCQHAALWCKRETLKNF